MHNDVTCSIHYYECLFESEMAKFNESSCTKYSDTTTNNNTIKDTSNYLYIICIPNIHTYILYIQLHMYHSNGCT